MKAKQFVKEADPEDFRAAESAQSMGALFTGSAETIYPAAIADLTAKLKDPSLCDNTSAEHTYLSKAKTLPIEAFSDALADSAKGFTQERLVNRAKAIEIARKYFTAKLHEECGETLALRITSAPAKKFKLFVAVQV
jgi:hypothetical protein